MTGIKSRLTRLEAQAPRPDHARVTEVHHHIINPDRTPALNPDGTPMIIIRRINPTNGRRRQSTA